MVIRLEPLWVSNTTLACCAKQMSGFLGNIRSGTTGPRTAQACKSGAGGENLVTDAPVRKDDVTVLVAPDGSNIIEEFVAISGVVDVLQVGNRSHRLPSLPTAPTQIQIFLAPQVMSLIK